MKLREKLIMFPWKTQPSHLQSNVPAFRSGQALADYVVPLVIGATVVLAFSASVYPDFRNYLTGVFNSEVNTPVDKSLTIRSLGKDPNLTSMVLVFPDGDVVRLNAYPKNIGDSIETTGVDGTTKLLSDTLLSLAQQLKDNGEITEEQFNRLRDLANQGHRMGDAQSLVRQAAENAGGNRDAFLNDRVSFSSYSNVSPVFLSYLTGQTNDYSLVPPELLATVPDSLRSTAQAYMPHEDLNRIKVGKETLQFFQLTQDVQTSGALNNPTVQKFVEQLSHNIFDISNQFNYETSKTTQPHLGVGPADIEKNVSATFTHRNSTAICSTGGSNDTGVYCAK